MSRLTKGSTAIAEDVMTKQVFTLRESESLINAWKIMREHKIRHLPVADTDGNIVGILTDRDLQRAIHTEFDQNGLVRFTIERFKAGEVVSDYMTSPVKFIPYDTPLATVATQMLEQKISCLLVSDANRNSNEAVGILTTDDLLWALIRRLNEEKEPLMKKLIDSLSVSPIGPLAHQLSSDGI